MNVARQLCRSIVVTAARISESLFSLETALPAWTSTYSFPTEWLDTLGRMHMGIQRSVTRTVDARRRGPIPCLSHFRWRRTVRPARRYPQCCGGLLPDSETLLQRWASRFHVSARNPVALLSHVGEDCAGAVQFVRSERLAAVLSGESDRQEPLPAHEIAQRLQRVRVDQAAARRLDDAGQFSLAGAQAKIALLQRDDGGWEIPAGRIPTTHILKPPSGDYDGFVENEVFCLRLARQVGMSAAFAEMICVEDAQAISVRRYDRIRTAAGWQRAAAV